MAFCSWGFVVSAATTSSIRRYVSLNGVPEHTYAPVALHWGTAAVKSHCVADTLPGGGVGQSQVVNG